MKGIKSSISLGKSEKERKRIEYEQIKYINSLYSELSKKVKNELDKIKRLSNVSEFLAKRYLDKLINDLNDSIEDMEKNLLAYIPSNMKKIINAVIKDQEEYFEEIGLDIENPYEFLPGQLENDITKGKMYVGVFTLRRSLQKNTKKLKKDMKKIVSEGAKQSLGIYTIVDSIRIYLNPSIKKGYEWIKTYPGINKRVAYNAQRLARTLASNSYQLAVEGTCKYNPFVDGYLWRINPAHGNVCPICIDREGNFFTKDTVPLDHPNGQCILEPSSSYTEDEIIDRISNWIKSPSGTDKEMDLFVKYVIEGSLK